MKVLTVAVYLVNCDTSSTNNQYVPDLFPQHCNDYVIIIPMPYYVGNFSCFQNILFKL